MFFSVGGLCNDKPRLSVRPNVFVDTIMAAIAESHQIPVSIHPVVGSKNDVMTVQVAAPPAATTLPTITSENILFKLLILFRR
jgi:hypothetical protein